MSAAAAPLSRADEALRRVRGERAPVREASPAAKRLLAAARAEYEANAPVRNGTTHRAVTAA